VNRDNVVPFEAPRRSGLARRGSPDKLRIVVNGAIELECPRCAAVLCLASKLPPPEVVCAACNSPLVSGEPETAKG
jgi:hypothetical protein